MSHKHKMGVGKTGAGGGAEAHQKEISWEEAVLRYLEDQPDFLLRHPELFASLTLKHEVGGRAVSLIEHQVQTLRARNQELDRQLHDLVGVARENDALGARLHRFALAMIGAVSADEALENACELLRQEFRLDAVAVRLLREPAGARAEYVGTDDRRLNELLKSFDGGKPVLDAARDESLRHYLFGERGADIRACALVPLGGAAAEGVLALGSCDAARFHAGMGTVYLARIGELLARALAAAPG
jgi:uncharacterized protein YigA (DUF484 family)